MRFLAVLLLAGTAAQGGMIHSRFTQKDGMNAVRFAGHVYTLDDLLAKRAENPRRFDHFHRHLGYSLGLGKDELLSRLEAHPRRFRHYHPILTYLLRNSGGSSVSPAEIGPPGSPPGSVPVTYTPQGGGGGGGVFPPQAVPEPSTLVLAAVGVLGGLGARTLRRRR